VPHLVANTLVMSQQTKGYVAGATEGRRLASREIAAPPKTEKPDPHVFFLPPGEAQPEPKQHRGTGIAPPYLCLCDFGPLLVVYSCAASGI
jgi:hypothetical protein